MKPHIKILTILFLSPLFFTGCLFSDYPIDEDGLLITGKSECYVSRFELLGSDFVTIQVGEQSITIDNGIDTLACTIHVNAKYGANLNYVYPRFFLSTDAKLEPKVDGFTDFSDLENPRQYTVISGNRKIRKTYTVHITQQEYNP